MELIHWDQKYRIGLPEIDRDHKAMIKAINDFYHAVEAKKEREMVKDFFAKVCEECAMHFAREEKFMLDHHYDQYAEHKAEQERLLAEIRDLADDFVDGVYDYDPEIALAKELESWFTNYVRTRGARLRTQLGQRSAGH